MPLSIIMTTQEQLVSRPVTAALRAGVSTCGSSVLFVPSFAQALDVQQALAQTNGLSLSVAVTTPGAWVKERWEVWGDGRTIADGVTLSVLARQAITQATPDELGPLTLSQGIVRILSQLVAQSLPWLPLSADGVPIPDACAQAGLTSAETKLIGLAGAMGCAMRAHGFVSAAQVSAAVPELLQQADVHMPHVVVAGFSHMRRAERELVHALAKSTQVTLVVSTGEGPAFEEGRSLAAWFGVPPCNASDSDAPIPRDAHLSALREALFGESPIDPQGNGPIELLCAAGPVAEAELVAQRVEELVCEVACADAATGVGDIVVSVADIARARRELVPKLAARGVTVRLKESRALLDCPAAQAFFAYAQLVAQLCVLDATWPAPIEGLEGPVAQLGSMEWWPPRELTDFLLSDIAHASTSQAWRSDAQWRSNRLLAPARLLSMLQSEHHGSPAVARATAELIRGRIGSAASKLLQPYVNAETDAAHDLLVSSDEALAVLQAVLQLAGSLRELGVTADPDAPGAVSLNKLVEICLWAAEGMSVVTRSQVGEGGPLVHIMSTREASQLAPGSVYALVACGLTTQESPIAAGDNLLQALLEQTGVEPSADPMAQARTEFMSLISAPAARLVLERSLHDADAKVTYPSVMLAELLSAYGISANASPADLPLPVRQRPETALAENLAPAGVAPQPSQVSEPAPAGRLTSFSQGFVFVPQDGSDRLPDGKPVLSASQIETYLDCPYKWFSLRRLRLGTVDAGHGGMEMGTFAHRVLEVTHRELLARALEAEQPGVAREELLAQIEADPTRHVAGSRVSAETLEAARVALDLEFDLHQQHMYMVRRPRASQQLLVAHTSADRAQEERLRQDLLSSLEFQTRILQGFEPRLFEWSFGRHENLVPYAGAYITGTVDRIDVNPHGQAVIIDYKHKSVAGFTAEYDALQDGVLEGEQLPHRVQSLIYAQVVRRAFEGRLSLAGTVFLSTKSPHALAGAADENMVDLIFGNVSSRRLPRVSVPRTPEGSGMDALLDRTEELVAEQVRQMLAGNVEARPRDKRSCDFCPVMQCERRVAR